MTFLMSCCCGTVFPEGKVGGALEEQTGTKMGGVRAALELGELNETFVSFILLMTLTEIRDLALSDRKLGDGLGET